MNLLGQPNFPFIFHKPSVLTISKALIRSTKVTRGRYSALGIFHLQTRWKHRSVILWVKRELNHFHWSKSVRYFLCR